jgi:hypothetical protein
MRLEVPNIRRWVRAGLAGAALAALTAGGVGSAAEGPIDWNQARQHWAFRPPQARPAPAVRRKDWPRQPVDAFVLARLEQKGLAPAPEADPRTLIRRVTFDLTGLPPTPDEVEAFVRECREEALSVKPQALGSNPRTAKSISGTTGSALTPNAQRLTPGGAYERLIDRLLASPRYGERMASMWLPLARYGEDQAHQVGSDTKFFYPNAYLYRQWVIDAFNHDLPYDRFVRLQVAADLLPKESPKPGAACDPPGATASASNDLAALGFLGLGPKYYNRNRLEVMADEWQDRVDTVTRTFLGLTVACARCHDHKYDPITTQDYYALAGVFASTKLVNKRPDGSVEPPASEAKQMRKDTLHVVEEDSPHDVNVFIRGNAESKGPAVPRRFLRVLSDSEPKPFSEGSGRKELAAAIASAENPLTARVLVNRVWGVVFGKPLVGTPSNFGLLGDRPTHPELLDDLAVRFIQGGWSTKRLVRELVLSSAYRQASELRVTNRELRMGNPASSRSGPRKTDDPVVRNSKIENGTSNDDANALLSHMNRRRLTVEQWRDAVLFVAGTLESGGGPSQELSDAANRKRTVYARISRLELNDLLMQFDYPDANVHAEKRSVTTTPMQKLFLLNSPFIQEQARALAARLSAEVKEGDEARVRRAYELLYGRPPAADETRLALAFLARPEPGSPAGMTRWERYAQALLAANEMMYVD